MKNFMVTCEIECAQCFKSGPRFCVIVGEGYDSHASGIMKGQMELLVKRGWTVEDKDPDPVWPGESLGSDAFCSKECYDTYCGNSGLAQS